MTDQPVSLGWAIDLHRRGLLQEALNACHEFLALHPGHGDALKLAGTTALQLDDPHQGIPLLERAVEAAPTDLEAHFNLGYALMAVGRPIDAVTEFGYVVALRPDHVDAHVHLGNACKAMGQFDEAGECYRRALDFDPRHAEAHNNLGTTMEALGRFDEAVAAFARCLEMRPDLAVVHCNQGRVLLRLNDAAAAAESCRRALELQPTFAEAHNLLGNALRMQGDLDGAEEAFGQALAVRPDFVEACSNLGGLLHEMGRPGDALDPLQRAVKIRPDYPQAHNNMGGVWQELGEHDAALAAFRQAIACRPDFREAHDNLLFVANYHPDLTPQEIFAEYRAWDERHARPPATAIGHGNTPDPDRRLRVGYVSPDFRGHACRLFVEPLLAAHDRSAVEIFAYAEVPRPDASTHRLQDLCDHWRDSVGMTDEALAEAIRGDAIDVLVELAGHTTGNRLPALARKPAPVQVSWLGYGYTTGLSAMDWFLADAQFVPEGSEHLFSEEIWRLPRTLFAFRPPHGIPEVGALPAAAAGGGITFGYFSRPVRLNHRVVAAWARILHAVEGSRLMLNNRPFTDSGVQERVLSNFAAHGIGGERLILTNTSPPWDSYNDVDIALDPFPHNAGTTTFEALWMGVPVLTLAARPSVGRLGASILNTLELEGWVMHSEDDYVARAVAAAADIDGLAGLRADLRQRMRASPLGDEAAFARDMEAAYRGMWRRWCDGRA